jgi:hypothetical protein
MKMQLFAHGTVVHGGMSFGGGGAVCVLAARTSNSASMSQVRDILSGRSGCMITQDTTRLLSDELNICCRQLTLSSDYQATLTRS